MTDDPDALLAALLADPPADSSFVSRVDALVAADRLYAARRRAAWRRFGQEAAGAVSLAVAATLLATAPGAGWALASLAAALPVAWVLAVGVRSPGSAAAR